MFHSYVYHQNFTFLNTSYVKPFTTSVLVLGPGQTTNVLIKEDQPPARYHMEARAYVSAQGTPFDNTITTTIIEYKETSCSSNYVNIKTVFPSLLAYNDTTTATTFITNFRSPRKVKVPTKINENLFITVGLGLNNCLRGARSRNCQGPNGTRFVTSWVPNPDDEDLGDDDLLDLVNLRCTGNIVTPLNCYVHQNRPFRRRQDHQPIQYDLNDDDDGMD
ncbi:Laccase-3 [Capsicum chinense]|nr:Laccase-3 [Capsicum chinense]